MKKEPDFEGLREAIKAGTVTKYRQIFKYVAVRDLFKAARLNPYGPALKRVRKPRLFKIGEVYQISEALGIGVLEVFKLIDNGRTWK